MRLAEQYNLNHFWLATGHGLMTGGQKIIPRGMNADKKDLLFTAAYESEDLQRVPEKATKKEAGMEFTPGRRRTDGPRRKWLAGELSDFIRKSSQRRIWLNCTRACCALPPTCSSALRPIRLKPSPPAAPKWKMCARHSGCAGGDPASGHAPGLTKIEKAAQGHTPHVVETLE